MAEPNHGQVVLAAIIPSRRDLLMYAITALEADHFPNDIHRQLFQLLDRYFDQAAGVMPRKILSEMLRKRVPVSKAILYEEAYDELAQYKVEDHEFRWSVAQLKDIRSQRMSGEAITTAMEILERGAEVDGKELKGHEDMWAYLYQEGSSIEQMQLTEVAPEGDIRDELREIVKDYSDRENKPLHAQGVFSGIRGIDNVTSGFQPGELILVVAYTGEGKSQFVTQTAWHAAVKQGKNVFFATTETIRPMVRRRLVARHSREPKFEIPGGFNTRDLKNGTLPPEHRAKLVEVAKDLTQNPAHGHIYLAQVPRGATLKFLEGRLLRQQASWRVDLVVMDYLALLKPERKSDNRVADFSDLLVDAKQIAATFDNGRGVPILSPWAIKQEKYTEALKTGYYTLGSLSDTSEAEKSSDTILSLLTMPDAPNQVKMQFLKNRDGETPRPFMVETDFKSTYLGDQQAAMMVQDLLKI